MNHLRFYFIFHCAFCKVTIDRQYTFSATILSAVAETNELGRDPKPIWPRRSYRVLLIDIVLHESLPEI